MTSTDFDMSTLTAESVPDTEFLTPDDPDAEFVEQYDEPNSGFMAEKKRSRKAVQYEKKTAGIFDGVFRVAVANPATVPDAAAIAMHAGTISTAVGDLADADPRVARAIDFVTNGTENPYAAVLAASMPLLLQVVRNHEPVLEPATRGIRFPFTKRRFNLKFGIRLGRVRNMTNDPDALAHHVFSNPEMQAALKKQGITVATRERGRR